MTQTSKRIKVDDAKLIKLMSEAYFKATGDSFYPEKDVMAEVLTAIREHFALSRRCEKSKNDRPLPDGKLTREDFDELSMHELLILLNRQLAAKRSCDDKIRVKRAELATITTNIHNIRHRIKAMSPLDEPTPISDHAILRYLQRVKGVDLAEVRNEIDSPVLRECIKLNPNGNLTIAGITYVLDKGTLVTVIYDEEAP